MKKIFLLGTVACSLALASCDDYLTVENTTNASLESYFDSDEAVMTAAFPLYNYVWRTFNDKFYYSVGDGRANNITARWSDYIFPYTNFTENAGSPGLNDAWGSFYSVVAQANNTINSIKENAGPAVTEGAKTHVIAECRFMRGLAYWYIGSVWGKGILYTNTVDQAKTPVVPPHRQTDVFEFAIRDLEYAAANLPDTQAQPGRATKYTAYGLLSRLYLSMAGVTTEGEYNGENIKTDFNNGSRNPYYLDLAKRAAEKCMEGPYDLMENFGDLFSVKTWNNNKESILQLQWLTGSTDAIGWGANNSMGVFFGWSTMVEFENWGNATYASFDLVREFDDPAEFATRRHWTICTYGDHYDDLNTANGGYDYGITESGYDDKCNFKKYVIGKTADNGISYKQSSGVNTYMMRLPEVYFNYVDAVLGNNSETTDAEALRLFNKVRTRVGLNPVRRISYETLRKEYRKELALEGQYWYFLVRRAYYQQSEVIGYLNNQDRNCSYEYNEAEACKYAKDTDADDVSTATAAHLLFPISDVDNVRNPLLNSTPVAYEFGEREVTTADIFN